MALLGRLGAFLQRAVETEEPRLDLPAAFTEHWTGITHYYLEATDESKPAKETDIPWHLKQMLDILVYEEKQQPSGETGPCLEYLLQHKVLETLSTLGKAEYPPGMRSQVLLFFSRLLGQMRCCLLHYLNVYRPVQKLLQLGSDTLGPDPEKEMIQFVTVLCTKIRLDPSLLPYTLEEKPPAQLLQPDGAADEALVGAARRLSSGSEEALDGVSPVRLSSLAQNLVSALVSLCKSKKRKVALKAQETLLLLTSIDHPTTTLALTHEGQLGPLLADHLCSLYEDIPATISPADVGSLPPVSWRLPGHSVKEESSFPGRLGLEAFFGWMDFCDCLTKEAQQLVVAKAVCEALGRRLFLGKLQPNLLQMAEDGILLSTALLTSLASRIKAPALLQELVAFVLGDVEEPSASEGPEQHLHLLRSHLISRCNHLSDEISRANLRLFEELLQLPDPRITWSLVLCHLEDRGYIQRNPSGQEEPSGGPREAEPCEEGVDLEEDPYFMDGFPSGHFQIGPEPGLPAALKRRPPPEGGVGVKEVVSSFLCLVPTEAKTSAYLEEAGYDTYVHDASALFQECCARASQWNWPGAPRPLESCPAGSSFYEGDFLKVLFNRLTQILDQPYAVNLQVTSVLSRLALFPHPHLHEYLLDPYLPLTHGCRSLFSVLIRVIGDLMQRTHRIPHFPANLLLVRRRLMGLVPEEQQISHQTLLEGVVVLEEFCKELAAIVFVKSMLEGPP